MSNKSKATAFSLAMAVLVIVGSVGASLVAASMWVGGHANRIEQLERRSDTTESLLRKIADDVAYLRGRSEGR